MSDSAFDIALALDIPGKGSPTGCMTYARALRDRLVAAGHQAEVVEYHWRGTDGEVLGMEDNHAIVLYWDEEGRLFGMDATSEKPKWLPGGKDFAEDAQWFAGDSYEVSNAVIVES